MLLIAETGNNEHLRSRTRDGCSILAAARFSANSHIYLRIRNEPIGAKFDYRRLTLMLWAWILT